MKKKLTIKELAPYLPYGIDISINGKIQKLNSIDSEAKLVCYGWGNAGFIDTDDVKPLLRPLSSLTEEIEHNGERFVPMVELEKIHKGIIIYQPLNLDYPVEITIQTEDYSQEIDLYDGYLIIQKLHEWHFDTANLLGLDLALPIEGKEVKP